DELESGDFNNDGIPDNEQNDGGLKTAVKGGGSMGSWLLVLMGFFVAARKKLALRRYGAVLLATSALVTGQASAGDCAADGYRLGGCWYLGAGLGVAHLAPEGQVNGWGADDNRSNSAEIYLGQYVTQRIFWELKYADAGAASLGNLNPRLTALIPDAEVSYEIPSLMAGLVVWSRAETWVFGKAGVSSIKTEASDPRIGQAKQTATQLAVGAGIRYAFAESPWQANLGIDSYDRDARVVSFGLSRRFE